MAPTAVVHRHVEPSERPAASESLLARMGIRDEEDLAALVMGTVEQKGFQLDERAAATLAAMAPSIPREVSHLLNRAIRTAASREQ